MKYLWSYLSLQGVSYDNSQVENRRIQLSNQACVISTSVMLVASVPYFVSQEYFLAIILMCTSPVYSVFILLNRAGNTIIVRFMQVFLGQLTLFLFALFLGKDAGLQYIYFPLICVPFALFDIKHKFIIVALFLTIIFFWMTLEITDYSIIKHDFEPVNQKFIHAVSLLSGIVMMVLFMYNYIISNARSEKALRNLLMDMEDKENELLDRNKQLKRTRDVLFKNQLKLGEAKNDAENAALAKANFLSNMSHEIRTPMNAVIGITDFVLSHGTLGKMEKENLETIRYSADNLLVIINDILDFSKIDLGKLELECIDFDLYKLVLELTKTLQFKAAEKGIIIHNEVGYNVPIHFEGDPYRLNQILVNLAGNAVKFTNEGVVTIIIRNISESVEACWLQFEVKDTGIGIPKDKLKSVFDNFSQASESTTRNYGGTGLGLAISKALVSLMGGELKVDSKSGVGSSFFFEITLKKVIEVEQELEKIDVEQNIEGIEVLLVEDYKMNQIVAEQFLNVWGVNVTIANDGEEALALTHIQKFDIILMDIQMPVMDGYDATLNIRNNIKNRNNVTPIIALTANAFQETKDKALKIGMDDFIAKPFNKDVLRNIICTNLSKVHAFHEL